MAAHLLAYSRGTHRLLQPPHHQNGLHSTRRPAAPRHPLCQCCYSTSATSTSATSTLVSRPLRARRRTRSLPITQAKRGRASASPADAGGSQDGDDEFGTAADDLVLDPPLEDDGEEDFPQDEGEDEGGFDDRLEDDEDEDIEFADEDEDEGEEEEGEEEGEDRGEGTELEEGEGEAEEGIQGEPAVVEENIDFKEFSKRSGLPPLSAVRANVDLPTDEEVRIALADEQPKPVIIPEGAQLSLNRQGYQAFQMGDIEFLVAETPDGKLDLQDCFIFDGGPEVYARPETSGKLPEQPIMLQAIPWIERKSGDVLKHKDPVVKMKKVFFVGVQSLQPYRVALDQVFKFEASSRVLSKEAVRTIGNPVDPILRIRPEGIIIEDSGLIPSPFIIPFEDDEQKAPQKREETEEERLERIREMEERAEELDRIDEQPDVPSSDMF